MLERLGHVQHYLKVTISQRLSLNTVHLLEELKLRDVDYKDTAKLEYRFHNHICCENN